MAITEGGGSTSKQLTLSPGSFSQLPKKGATSKPPNKHRRKDKGGRDGDDRKEDTPSLPPDDNGNDYPPVPPQPPGGGRDDDGSGDDEEKKDGNIDTENDEDEEEEEDEEGYSTSASHPSTDGEEGNDETVPWNKDLPNTDLLPGAGIMYTDSRKSKKSHRPMEEEKNVDEIRLFPITEV